MGALWLLLLLLSSLKLQRFPSLFFIFNFISLNYVYVCMCVYMHASAQGAEVPAFLELELQAVISWEPNSSLLQEQSPINC